MKDSLANAGEYEKLGKGFAGAMAFLKREDLADLPPGRYDIDGDDAYAMVQDATLRTWGTARPELHRAYFDIHMPISGEETVGVGKLVTPEPPDFDVKNDFGLCDDAPVEPLVLHPGEFAILYPRTCVHSPCCAAEGGGTIRKVVVKIRG